MEKYFETNYDLVIVGAGSGGFSSSYWANKNGLKTLLISSKPIGGTCVNIGCVPSKFLLDKSKILEEINKSNLKNLFRELSFEEREALFLSFLKETKQYVKELQKRNYLDVLKKFENVDFLEAKASFKDGSVFVEDKRVKAKNIVLATGAKPFLPPIEIEGEFLTYRNFWDLKELPEKVVIVGSSVMAVEFATILSRFTEVTIVFRSSFLKKFLPSQSEFVKNEFLNRGIKLVKATPKKVSEGKLITEKGEIEGAIMFCTGISPNSESFEVEKDKRGFVITDEFLRVKGFNNVYAIGDLNGKLPLETTAALEGKVAVENILGANKKVDYNKIPSIAFSSPQIARVGIMEGRLIHFDLSKLERKSKGFLDLFVKNNKIVGVVVGGYNVEELINTASFIINLELSPGRVSEITLAFPTIGEAIKKASLSTFHNLDETPCCIN